MDGQLKSGMNGKPVERTDNRANDLWPDVQTASRMHRQMNGLTTRQPVRTDGRTDCRPHGRTDGVMNSRMDGQTNGRSDRWIE